jgi:two-component sensor histidine kinase
LSNALKHAFPGDRVGAVSVVFHETGSGWVELAVEDDGVGLSAGWDRSQSLGWQIIPILARQCGWLGRS